VFDCYFIHRTLSSIEKQETFKNTNSVFLLARASKREFAQTKNPSMPFIKIKLVMFSAN